MVMASMLDVDTAIDVRSINGLTTPRSRAGAFERLPPPPPKKKKKRDRLRSLCGFACRGG